MWSWLKDSVKDIPILNELVTTFDTLFNALKTKDLGQLISDTISNIDWVSLGVTVATSLWEGIKSVLMANPLVKTLLDGFNALSGGGTSSSGSPQDPGSVPSGGVTLPTIDWSIIIPSFDWSSWLSPNSWSNWLFPNNWSSWLSPNSWSNWLSPNHWGNWLSPNRWSNWLSSNSWSSWITGLNWTSFITPVNLANFVSGVITSAAGGDVTSAAGGDFEIEYPSSNPPNITINSAVVSQDQIDQIGELYQKWKAQDNLRTRL